MIAGPTAAGKTNLAIEVAKHFGAVIISADSRQFYRELNIGTAKPDASQLSEVRHYMINNKSIGELYGAGHFATEALQLLEELYEGHDVVVMAGGSGLYIEALLHGVDEFGQIPPAIRAQINTAYSAKGLSWLQQEIKSNDPQYYTTVDINNPQRLLRALEVYMYTGKSYSSFLAKQRTGRPFRAIKILLTPGREELYERINTRCDSMMQQGLLGETRQLLPYKTHNALKTVGYKELFAHLEGQCTLEDAVAAIKQHTRNYAKRQLTWFRNRDAFRQFKPEETAGVIDYIDETMRTSDDD